MAQHRIRHDVPLQLDPEESEFFYEHPRYNSGGSLNRNSGKFGGPESFLGAGYIRKTGSLRSSDQGEQTGQNNLPARVGHSGISLNCRLENLDHVIFDHQPGRQAAPRDQLPGSVTPEQDSAKSRKAPDGRPNFGEFVFDSATNASIPRVREISSAKGRTGPMSLNSRVKTKSVKDAGGSCWRCKLVGKGCDAKDPCDECPRKATPWQALGCRRGTLWDVLPRVILCSHTSEQSESALGGHPKGTISSAKEHELIVQLANTYLPRPQNGCILSLSGLLSSAARYGATAPKDQLIDSSGLCLKASLQAIQAIQAQEESQLYDVSHTTCTPSACKIDSFNELNNCLKGYVKLLSGVIFKKNARRRKDWWLSVFYSFCIQSFVRGAIIVLVSKSDANHAIAASQYLHLAVNLFFVTCKATDKSYDPLLYDFDKLSDLEILALTQHGLEAEQGRLAQIAVQKDSWEANRIDSSYDYLYQLFDMDRTVFVPPASRPPICGDDKETIDEATHPPPKKRRLNKQSEQQYTSDHPTGEQILDTHIIHPGSLELSHSTAELPPPIPDLNDCNVRENPAFFESDMYTPRWVRGFRDEEGWCGFCSRWFKLRDAWFNDRCLFHGICADTGKGFAQPKEPVNINPAGQIWEAKCETCAKNVRYRKGDRWHYSGWYMHAANCEIERTSAEIREETEDDTAILTLGL